MNNQKKFVPVIITLIIVALLAGGILAWQFWSKEATPELNLETTKLAIIPENYEVREIVFSPDGKQVAYTAKEEGKWLIVLNDKEGKRYDEVGWPIFSPDSKQLAYRAIEGLKEFIVLNDKEGKRYDKVRYLTFSPDSKQLAYRAIEGEKMFVVLNDKEGKRYDKFWFDDFWEVIIVFSPDSKQLAYMAREGVKEFVVFNGKEGKRHDSVGNLTFSPDSKQLAYTATEGEKMFVVLNDKEGNREGNRYDVVGKLTFSPDSKQLAYRAREGRKEFVVFNDKEGKRQGKRHDSVGNLTFSPDSKQLAYTAREGEKEFIVLNGKEGKRHDSVGNLTFSPDSKQLAYTAREGEKEFVVLNNKEENIYDVVGKLTFSPDGKQLAYVAIEEGKMFVVLNDKEGKRYNVVWNPVFSHDNKYLAYGAQDGNELWWIVEPVGQYFGVTKEEVNVPEEETKGKYSVRWTRNVSELANVYELLTIEINDLKKIDSLYDELLDKEIELETISQKENKRIVRNCREYLCARKEGFGTPIRPVRNLEIVFFEIPCFTLQFFKKAQNSKISYLNNFNLKNEWLNLPLSEVFSLDQKSTFGNMEDIINSEIEEASEHYVKGKNPKVVHTVTTGFSYPFTFELYLMGWGDFNGDKIEDILLYTNIADMFWGFENYAPIIVTKLSDEDPIIMVEAESIRAEVESIRDILAEPLPGLCEIYR